MAGKWGSTFGDSAYDFRGAIGLDADNAGRIYVTDTGNDRIQVYDPNTTKLQDAAAPQTPTISAPANQGVVPLGPVTITGTATDAVSVASVDLQIQDMTTGLWWDPSQSSYRPTIVQPILAAYSSNTAPATSVQWRYTFLGLTAGHEYLVRARTRDANGGISQMAQRTFGMPGTSPVAAAPPLPSQDTTRPNGLLAFPIATPQQTLPFAPITFSGTATDDVGVNQVRISLKRLSNNQYWSGSTSGSGFSSTFRYWDTVLDTPGGTSTGWTWAWTPRASTVPGDFQLLVQAIDAAGNVDNSTPNVKFTVSNLPPDTVAPDTTVSTPTEGQDLPTGQVSITGTATDNTNVASVRVGIQNSTDQWWNGTSFQAAATTVNANLNTPGTTVEQLDVQLQFAWSRYLPDHGDRG